MAQSKEQGSSAAQSSFYTHDTDIYSPTDPHFTITSKTLPLQLRSLASDDRPALLKHYSDIRNVEHDRSVAGLATPAAIDALITQWTTFTQPLDRLNAIITIGGDFIGTGGIGWIGSKPDGRKIGDAGVMLDTEARGKGYAYEALRITIDYGFTVLALDEVHLATKSINAAMRGLMEKKLRFEGVRTREDRFGNDWLWKIEKKQWFQSVHSLRGMKRAVQNS